MKLHNHLSKEELVDLFEAKSEKRLTISFYQYAHIGNPEFFRNYLYFNFAKADVMGRIYVSTEGINAQISVPVMQKDVLKAKMDDIDFLRDIRLNYAIEDDGKSFFKLKIKVRHKILADGLNDDTFDVTDCGEHVDAEKFNQLLEDPNTVTIDMRNHYETEIGHFTGAVTPDVDTFRDSLPLIEEMLEDKKDKNLLMYCTGGIRCEKASAWFKHQGFENVFQMNGGIINYARQVSDQGLENKYIGKNFVFDERRAETISEDIIANCHQCGNPFDVHTNCANVACNLLFIQCPDCKEKMNNCCSNDCKTIHSMPEEEQKALRKGTSNSNKIFSKGRSSALKYKK